MAQCKEGPFNPKIVGESPLLEGVTANADVADVSHLYDNIAAITATSTDAEVQTYMRSISAVLTAIDDDEIVKFKTSIDSMMAIAAYQGYDPHRLIAHLTVKLGSTDKFVSFVFNVCVLCNRRGFDYTKWTKNSSRQLVVLAGSWIREGILGKGRGPLVCSPSRICGLGASIMLHGVFHWGDNNEPMDVLRAIVTSKSAGEYWEEVNMGEPLIFMLISGIFATIPSKGTYARVIYRSCLGHSMALDGVVNNKPGGKDNADSLEERRAKVERFANTAHASPIHGTDEIRLALWSSPNILRYVRKHKATVLKYANAWEKGEGETLTQLKDVPALAGNKVPVLSD